MHDHELVVLSVVLKWQGLKPRRERLLKKIKGWLADARAKKRVHSDELERIINRCKNKYSALFPNYRCVKNGSKSVHHFGVKDVLPISLERVHGNRDHVPKPYVTYILDGLELLAAYIEANTEEEELNDNINEEPEPEENE